MDIVGQKRGLRMQKENIDVSQYLNKPIECECGRTHFAGIKTLEISKGALDKVASIVKEGGFKKPFVISDCNTQAIAGDAVLRQLAAAEIPHSSFVFADSSLSPDEEAVGRLLMHYDPTCDLIIGVGAGTINDVCRFFSYQLGIQYYIVATAPSMDGYASSVAPLIKNNLKTTFECHAPTAIIADLDILAEAPKEMIAAGFGDVVGKYSCLADWKLSSIINDEYYCQRVADLTRRSLERTVELREGIAKGDRDAIEELMKALVLSGVAISYVGNSRPASGCEHHIAHFWEMRMLWEGREPVFHGTKVGIAAGLVSHLYHYLREENVNLEELQQITTPSAEVWAADVERVFSQGAAEIFALEERAGKNDPERHRMRLESIAANWGEIRQALELVPSPDWVTQLLEDVDAPVRPGDVEIDKEVVHDALLYAKEIRDRYTLLQLLWDLDLLKKFAQRLMSNSYYF